MCTPLLVGLALVAAGTAAQAGAKQQAANDQLEVVKNAQKATTATRNANRQELMTEVKKNSPTATAATDGVAASQQQAAMQSGANQAVDLFQGSAADQAAAGRITDRVQSSLTPRTKALGVIQGQVEGERQRSRSMDRVNQNNDARDSANGRMLGLMPLQMQLAAQSGRGLAMAGQAAGAIGGGMVSNSMWSQPSTTASTGAGGQITSSAGGTDLYGRAVSTDMYGNPVTDPTISAYGQT